MKGLMAAVVASTILVGCGSGPDVELEWNSKPVNFAGMRGELQFIDVTNLEDGDLEIAGLVANRGNCRVVGDSLPKTIAYGEIARIQLNNDCNVREVDLETSSGSATFEW